MSILDEGNSACEPYLHAVLMLLHKEPPDGRLRLIEAVLDGRAIGSQGGGRWRRFHTDNDTVLMCGVPNAPAEETQILFLPGVRWSTEAARETALDMSERLRHLDPESWRIHHVSFTVGGVAGVIMECWGTKSFLSSPLLLCPQCGSVYDLESDAYIVTPELTQEILLERGNRVWVSRDPAELPPIPTDLVSLYPDGHSDRAEQFDRSLCQVLADLRHGRGRRWTCSQGHEHGYPGTFFRHQFANIEGHDHR